MIEESHDIFMMEAAYYNSYLIVTDQITLQSLMDGEDLDDTFVVLAHNPDKEVDNVVIQKLIDYYAVKEEFEMCNELSLKLT